MTPAALAPEPLTIREARQYLLQHHGIRMSRATFWREFMTDAEAIVTVWCGILAVRGSSAAWTFTCETVDRMAAAYRARRQGRTVPRCDSAASPVERFGERRPRKKRRTPPS